MPMTRVFIEYTWAACWRAEIVTIVLEKPIKYIGASLIYEVVYL